ncbi:MRN complex-interacting protein isoform X2 [Anoplolepis gracilipes]|uniref:MRN complex-interacting protein isoform X2 n=1 Tax=Anoplolepis gracilipes TaxID=354296 RepID=UPI003B9FE1E2
MPQEMNVLCCYSCKMYQVHIVKKAPKWHCKIYFQGSGRDCRLHVQQLNAKKANDTFFMSSEQDDINDACDTFASIPQESDSDNAPENKWTKYLESSEMENLEGVENVIFDKEANEIIPGKEFPRNINKDLLSFEKYLNDTDSESENVDNETKELLSTSLNCNSNIDKCDMQDNTDGDHTNAADIFETYDELDEPLDL